MDFYICIYLLSTIPVAPAGQGEVHCGIPSCPNGWDMASVLTEYNLAKR